MSAEEYREKLDRIYAAAAEAGRTVAHFEPALLIQTVLGSEQRSTLENMAKVPTAAAMSMLLPGALWSRHGLKHPLRDDFEGFPDFVPEEITREHVESAQRQVTPELLADGVFAGSVEEVVAGVRPLVDAGLRHLVIWNIGPLANGAGLGDMVRLATLIRRLRKITLRPGREPPADRLRVSETRG
jgi:phthiodiolone/phenolphthiodiolone dimycocerosates ketoreductase